MLLYCLEEEKKAQKCIYSIFSCILFLLFFKSWIGLLNTLLYINIISACECQPEHSLDLACDQSTGQCRYRYHSFKHIFFVRNHDIVLSTEWSLYWAQYQYCTQWKSKDTYQVYFIYFLLVDFSLHEVTGINQKE